MSVRHDILARTPRILIVDDERQNRQLLEVMLTPEGFFLESAASGEEALGMVAQESPDLILLDIMMPGMDGYQVAAKIKGNPSTKNIPVIMITALDDRHAKMLGLKAGAEDFLTRPVDRLELCMRVRNLLRLKAYGDYYDKYSHVLEAEAELRTAELVESELLYRSTFNGSPVGIVHADMGGQWLRVNQRLCDLLGYSREELQSPGAQGLIQSEEVAGEAEALRQMAAGILETHVVDEKRYRRRNGDSIWARVNVAVHRDASGLPQHFILVIEDVTERRTLEAQLRQASKMDSIGRLASGVAHDFNNLLTIILGFTELMNADVDIVNRHANHLSAIHKAAKCAAGLTKQLLAFSRQQVLHAVSLDVNSLITDMTGMLRMLIGKHIDVVLALSPNLAQAFVDRGQLEQVVMNLVVNAKDAMPDGGSITIETKDVEIENSPFHDEEVTPGHYVMLAITDTGGGMTKEIRRRLLEPFFTTKEVGKGTGLGLSTTYGIVKQSKGHIWVYSELGLGTTFKVYLPRQHREVPLRVLTSPVTSTNKKKGAETVLLVEDETDLRQLLRRMLDKAGYRVFEAANGADAERIFARHADLIDLVVSDVIMPVCSGPELLRRLHIKVPALKVLYMLGHTEQSVVRRMIIDCDLPFIQKPFTEAEFVQKVRDASDGVRSRTLSVAGKIQEL